MAKKAPGRLRIPLYSNQPPPKPVSKDEDPYYFPDFRIGENESLFEDPGRHKSRQSGQKTFQHKPMVSNDQNIPSPNSKLPHRLHSKVAGAPENESAQVIDHTNRGNKKVSSLFSQTVCMLTQNT